MGFWNRWPYSNFHEINLDWILSKIKEIYGKVNDFAREWVKKLDEEAQIRKEADDALNARVDQEISDRTEADEAEAAARQEADEQLQDNINKEQQRAEAAEKALDDKITAETERATAAESNLQEQITAEVNRATSAENTLDQKITAETSRATSREDELEGMITTETERATAKETELDQKITTETQRATAAEEALGERIDGIEGELDGITGAESPFICKDGTTTTTGKIPLAMGGTSETDPAAATDLVNLRSMQAADEAIQQAMTEYVDSQLEAVTGDIHSIPAGGTTGQVLSKVDATDYNTQWIDPPSGSDPDAIKKDGTTVTTEPIPFAEGIQVQSIRGGAGATPTISLGSEANSISLMSDTLTLNINRTNGDTGQVLTAQGDGTCRWEDASGAEFTTTTKLACLKYPYSGGHVVEVYANSSFVLSSSTYFDDIPEGFAPANPYAGGVLCACTNSTTPVDAHPVYVIARNSRRLDLIPTDATSLQIPAGTFLIKYMTY